ncbi:hypothetical protein [Cytobacillus kochii]|uniref:Uncharacterized protein n=1 Tax=Cytobacillus kochii TaxID=859143 RepID=A0A248TLH7_9BACI|nr:hypothetical protein [Cytobacillus kochii]ASV69063.1 hypothetical protein CKF48_18220 [Cytobacillus kochii]
MGINMTQPGTFKSKFHRQASVLSEGFTDRDATPPSMPAYLNNFRKIGIYNMAELEKEKAKYYQPEGTAD